MAPEWKRKQGEVVHPMVTAVKGLEPYFKGDWSGPSIRPNHWVLQIQGFQFQSSPEENRRD
jgi:hypothetical protein